MKSQRKPPERLLKELARALLIAAVLGAVAGTNAPPAQARWSTRPPPAAALRSAPTPTRAAGTGGWRVVPSPNTGSPNNYLLGVAALAPNDAWAVGAYGIQGVTAQPLIEHWDGAQWSIAATPALTMPGELLAVSAVAAGDVWAAGGYNTGGRALVAHWDGASWTAVPNPNPGTFNRFLGVAAISSADVWAVGLFGNGGLNQTLVEHWDGASWTVIPSPNVPDQHNQLSAVTAVPRAPGELWAVGAAGPSALILHWNGSAWSLVPGPAAGTNPGLTGVAALAAADVWAVGTTGGSAGPVTLTEHWDGAAWRVVPSPSPSATDNHLRGVTALAPDNVWAVGDFNAPGGNRQTLILQWNGTAWVQVPGDNAGPSGVGFALAAVSALGANDIWSVGENSHALAEHWDGSSWRIVAAPNAGTGANVLSAVSGRAAAGVWGVGEYAFGIEKRTLVEYWDGAAWRLVPSPNTDKRTNVLSGAVALAPDDAWAVGRADSGNALDQITLILHWDGAAWRIVPSPSPGTAGLNALYAVAASAADDVWAVGSRTNSGSVAETLVEHWDGTTWQVIPSANVPGANNELYGVAAHGPRDAWAVGYSGSVAFSPLVEHWDGAAWSVVPSPDPPGASNILRAVSAAGARRLGGGHVAQFDHVSDGHAGRALGWEQLERGERRGAGAQHVVWRGRGGAGRRLGGRGPRRPGHDRTLGRQRLERLPEPRRDEPAVRRRGGERLRGVGRRGALRGERRHPDAQRALYLDLPGAALPLPARGALSTVTAAGGG